MREGLSQRIEGDYPSEVQPLVDDLNALIEDRERAIARALTTAGDLEHVPRHRRVQRRDFDALSFRPWKVWSAR